MGDLMEASVFWENKVQLRSHISEATSFGTFEKTNPSRSYFISFFGSLKNFLMASTRKPSLNYFEGQGVEIAALIEFSSTCR